MCQVGRNEKISEKKEGKERKKEKRKKEAEKNIGSYSDSLKKLGYFLDITRLSHQHRVVQKYSGNTSA